MAKSTSAGKFSPAIYGRFCRQHGKRVRKCKSKPPYGVKKNGLYRCPGSGGSLGGGAHYLEKSETRLNQP